jgi:hypothetical protein
MSSIQSTIDRVSGSNDESVIVVNWNGLAASGDVGTPVTFAAWSERTYFVVGTFTGSPTVIIEGSADGVNWLQITNRQGTPLSFTAAGLNTSQDRPVYVRPRLTAGTGGAAINVQMVCHRFNLAGMGR